MMRRCATALFSLLLVVGVLAAEKQAAPRGSIFTMTLLDENGYTRYWTFPDAAALDNFQPVVFTVPPLDSIWRGAAAPYMTGNGLGDFAISGNGELLGVQESPSKMFRTHRLRAGKDIAFVPRNKTLYTIGLKLVKVSYDLGKSWLTRLELPSYADNRLAVGSAIKIAIDARSSSVGVAIGPEPSQWHMLFSKNYYRRTMAAQVLDLADDGSGPSHASWAASGSAHANAQSLAVIAMIPSLHSSDPATPYLLVCQGSAQSASSCASLDGWSVRQISPLNNTGTTVTAITLVSAMTWLVATHAAGIWHTDSAGQSWTHLCGGYDDDWTDMTYNHEWGIMAAVSTITGDHWLKPTRMAYWRLEEGVQAGCHMTAWRNSAYHRIVPGAPLL